MNKLPITCPNCGAPLDYDKDKCEYCGTTISAIIASITQTPQSSKRIVKINRTKMCDTFGSSSEGWVNVKQSLPSHSGKLWVKTRKGYEIAYYDIHGKWSIRGVRYWTYPKTGLVLEAR